MKSTQPTPKTITLPNDQLIPAIRQVILEGHTATFRVRGYSMRPGLENGRDKAVIAPLGESPVRKGDVILAEISPRVYVLHRVIRVEGDRLTLRGDGNVRGTETCRTTDVIGIATGFYRGKHDKYCATDSRAWRFYSRIWPSAPFIRRGLLAAYRRIYLPLVATT